MGLIALSGLKMGQTVFLFNGKVNEITAFTNCFQGTIGYFLSEIRAKEGCGQKVGQVITRIQDAVYIPKGKVRIRTA